MSFDQHSIDAMHWAEEFCKTMQDNHWTLTDIDEELMVGWFANYWAAVHDPLQRRIVELAASNRNLTDRNALLRQRPDLPVDRIPAHTRLIELQKRVEELEIENVRLQGDHVRCPSCHDVFVLCNGRLTTAIKPVGE